MRIRKSGVIRTSFIASALAMLFPLSALGQQSAEATQLDPVTIRDTADSIGYVPTYGPHALIANRRTCEVSLRMNRRKRIAPACLAPIQAMTIGENA